MVDNSFLSLHKKCSAHFWPLWFQIREPFSCGLGSPIVLHSLSTAPSTRLSLPMIFQKFIYDEFMDVLGFTLLGICSASWICVSVLFIKFGRLLPNIHLNSLSAPVSLLLLLRFLQFECSVSVIVSGNPEALLTFSSLFTLNCSGQLNSIDPSPNLSTLSLVVSTLLLSPSSNRFFVVAVVCLLKTSISLLRFSIFKIYF